MRIQNVIFINSLVKTFFNHATFFIHFIFTGQAETDTEVLSGVVRFWRNTLSLLFVENIAIL
jgi:hypothetical protein